MFLYQSDAIIVPVWLQLLVTVPLQRKSKYIFFIILSLLVNQHFLRRQMEKKIQASLLIKIHILLLAKYIVS